MHPFTEIDRTDVLEWNYHIIYWFTMPLGDASKTVDNQENITTDVSGHWGIHHGHQMDIHVMLVQFDCCEWLDSVTRSEESDSGQSMELRKGGMGGIIGFGFRYIKYLMCIQSEPKQSVSLAVHRNARCRREHVEKRTGCKKGR